MAMEFTGQPVPNTALLAALVTMTDMLPLKALEDALATCFRAEALERNLKLARYVAQMLPTGVWKDPTAAISELQSPREAYLH
jgi:pyruvate ferredoxin oxidoreductase gamma subunit